MQHLYYSFDETAPTLASASPSDNQTDFPFSSNIVLTFSEAVAAGSGNILISTGSNTNGDFESIPIDDDRITFSSERVTINPSGTFQSEGSYNVLIPAGAIKDPAGNFFAGITSATTLNFTIKDYVVPTMTITATDLSGTNVTTDQKLNGNLTFTFTASEPTTNFALGDISVSGGSLSNFVATLANYTATFT